MTWLWVAVIIAVIGAALAVAAGFLGESAASLLGVAPDRRAAQLSTQPLTDDDLANVRFTQALRGYAMDEVDDFIARLRAELASRPDPAAAEYPDDAFKPDAAHSPAASPAAGPAA